MGSPQVVDRQPAFGLEADVGQRAEDIGVENFLTMGPGEAFDVGVLRRLAPG